MKTLCLWGKDHEDRARELAIAYAGEHRDVKKSTKKISGLTRLSYWGHGIPAEFCEMTPPAFVANLKSWKKKNSNIDSVDILTCNGRYTGNGEKSFTDQVLDLMRQRDHSVLQGIKLRALPNPTTPSGKTCNYSILSRDKATNSWSYVATPGYFGGTSSQYESHMFGAKYFLDQMLKLPNGGRRNYVFAYTEMMNMQPITVRSAYALQRNWDQKKVDDFNAKLKATKEDAYIMVGTSVGSLLWHLREIN